MDDNRDKRTRASSDDTGIDGEYHFVRPEQRLYEDAEFVPQDEATEVPHYYAPEEKKPREKSGSAHRSGTLKTACLCLVCALVGGLAGGFISWNAVKGSIAADAPAGDATKPIVSTTNIKKVSTETASANEIYELGCRQTVGVSLESTYANIFGQRSASAVAGTGFVITADGYILTNYHVVESAQKSGYKVSVLFKDKSSYEAKIIGFDEDNDVAVLKIDASDLTPATIGNSDDIAVGDSVFAIGNPLGVELRGTLTDGIVSAINRDVDVDGVTMTLIQTNAALNNGNSGGPLINRYGQVIGINVMKMGMDRWSTASVEGLGFAIPIASSAYIVNDILRCGEVQGEPVLGISVDRTPAYLPDGQQAARVYTVDLNGPGDKAGLEVDDLIYEADGVRVETSNDLLRVRHRHAAGEEMILKVCRGGEYLTVSVTLEAKK